MEWTDFFKLIGVTGLFPVLLLIVIGFWGKKIVEYFFQETMEFKRAELSEQLELHKSKLEQQNRSVQSELDKNLESHKNKLELMRLEYQIQFSQLHMKRSEVIIKLYELICILHNSAIDLTTRIHPVIEDGKKEENERRENMAKALYQFSKFYDVNKIFFTKDLQKQIDDFWSFANYKVWNFAYIGNRLQNGRLQPEIAKDFYKESTEISEQVQSRLPKMKAELEDEFRKLLGVEE